MKRLLVASFVLSLAAAAVAAPSFEAARAAADKTFLGLSAFKPSLKASVAPPVKGRAVVKPEADAKAKGSRYVRVTGQVNLTGSGYVPNNGNGSSYVSVNFHGTTDLQDSTGKIRSGYTSITTYSSLWVHGNYVSDWVRPSAYVSFYQDGRFIGSARVDGSIHVSGFLSGSWVRLNGYGTLSGDILVQDP